MLTHRLCKCSLHRPAESKAIGKDRERYPQFRCPLRSHLRAPLKCQERTGCVTHLQGSLQCPSTIKTSSQCRFGNPSGFRPFRQRVCLALQGQQTVVGPITPLFKSSGPSDVPRFVVSILVRESIQAVFDRRSRPHVGQEVRERFTPSITDSDSTTSVSGICVVVSVVAASDHVYPGSILGRVRAAMRSDCFHEEATATRLAAFSDNCCMHVAAFALTQPTGATFTASGVPHDSEATENLPSQVFHEAVTSDRIICSHDDAPYIRVARMAGRRQPCGCSLNYTLTA
jgi:hypothetical protein